MMAVIVVEIISIPNTVLNANVLMVDQLQILEQQIHLPVEQRLHQVCILKNKQKLQQKLIVSFLLGCTNPGWVGDGYCDDVTNNMACNYDSGDCCLDPVNTQYCSECQCIDDSGSTVDPGTTESPTSGTTTPSGIKNTISNTTKNH